MTDSPFTRQQILDLLPQKPPFRFVDELLELSDDHAVGIYTFKHDEGFYAGHFPEEPITPGVILLESMCQVGLVALGLHLLSKEVSAEDLPKSKTLFTDSAVDFSGLVLPGNRVTTHAEKVFWRRKKLRSKVTMTLDDGTIVASGIVSGMGVRFDS